MTLALVRRRGHDVDYELAVDEVAARAAMADADEGWLGEVVFDNRGEADERLPPVAAPAYAVIVAADRGGMFGGVFVHEWYGDGWRADAAREAQYASRVIAIRLVARKPPLEPLPDERVRELHALTVAHRDDGASDDDDFLVLADALGGKRGTFVIVQCDLARDGMTPAESRGRRRMQRKAIARHGKAWSRLDGLADSCCFRRGFVDAIDVRSGVRPAQIADRAPHARSVSIAPASGESIQPWLDLGVTGVHLRGDVAALDGAELPRLRAFGVHDLDDAHAAALVAQGLGDLDVLALGSPDPRARERLLAASPSLRMFDQWNGAPFDASILPASVRELHIRSPELCAGGLPRALEKLVLIAADLRDPAALAPLASLRSLDLYSGRVTPALAELPLHALRELRAGQLDARTALAIARAFGAHLELFNILGGAEIHEIEDELRDAVAGDFVYGDLPGAIRGMPASYAPYESLWDLATVDFG